MVKTSVVYFHDAFTFTKLGIMIAKSEGDAEALGHFPHYENAFLTAGSLRQEAFDHIVFQLSSERDINGN
jgi:hypothetical protein